MGFALTGPLANFFTVDAATGVLDSNGQHPSTSGPVAWTLTETRAGYDNSPLASTGTTWVEAAPSTGPIAITAKPVPERTWTPSRGGSAPVAVQFMDPSDQSPWWLKLSNFLTSDEPLATIVSINPSAAATALGIGIDTAARRPGIDLTAKIIEIRLLCNQPGNPSFAGDGVMVPLEFTFTTGESLVATYQLTVYVRVKQL